MIANPATMILFNDPTAELSKEVVPIGRRIRVNFQWWGVRGESAGVGNGDKGLTAGAGAGIGADGDAIAACAMVDPSNKPNINTTTINQEKPILIFSVKRKIKNELERSKKDTGVGSGESEEERQVG